jgi:preprotein translocase SecE subunit
VARQTRAQRKARREQQGDSAAIEQRGRSRSNVPARAPADGGNTMATVEAAPSRDRRGGPIGFIGECWAELQKVEWPGQRQVTQGTVVVLIACAVVGAYLWGVDLVLKRFVENVLLGQ